MIAAAVLIGATILLAAGAWWMIRDREWDDEKYWH